MTTCYVAGLDLGRERDHSALAIVERRRHHRGHDAVRFAPIFEYDLCLRRLHRFALGTPYHEVVATVERDLRGPLFAGQTPLVVDATGVGGAVIEMFRKSALPLYPVVITGGEHTHYTAHRLHAPKTELVTTLAVLLEQDKFRVARSLALADELKRELSNFSVEARTAGRHRFGAAAGGHDDLVLAVSLAAWFAVRQWPEIFEPELGRPQAPLAFLH